MSLCNLLLFRKQFSLYEKFPTVKRQKKTYAVMFRLLAAEQVLLNQRFLTVGWWSNLLAEEGNVQ